MAAYWTQQPLPDGMHVDHTCSTPACFNPLHLQVVPAKANIGRSSPRRWMADDTGVLRCHRGHDVSDPANVITSSGVTTCRVCRNERTRRLGKKPVGALHGWAAIDAAQPHPTLTHNGTPCLVFRARRASGRAGNVTINGARRSAAKWVLMRAGNLTEPPKDSTGKDLDPEHLCRGALEGCIASDHLTWISKTDNSKWQRTLGLTVEELIPILDQLGIDPRDGGGVQETLNANGYSVHRGGATVSEAQRRRRKRDGWITWRTPTEELAAKLDELGITPIEEGRDVAARLQAMGHRVGKHAVWKAQKLRQQRGGILRRGSNPDDVIALLEALGIPPEETVKNALAATRAAGHGVGRHAIEHAQNKRRGK